MAETTAKTHELRLKIDAAAAKRGSREFTATISAVKQAVRDLDKDATGAFTKLKSIKPEIDVTPLTLATTETNKLTSASDKAAIKLSPPLSVATGRTLELYASSTSSSKPEALLPLALSSLRSKR